MQIDVIQKERGLDKVVPSKKMNPAVHVKSVSTHVQRQTKGQRKEWSKEEKNAVEQALGKYFFLKRLPGKFEIEQAMRKQPVLNTRPWKQIKYFII